MISANPLDLRGQDLRGDELATRRLAGADLSDSNLEGVQLDGREMTGARLDGANLSGASLRATTLEDSSLIRTTMRFTDLTDSVLESADLSHIDGWGVKLDRAELRGARLDFAELEEASLTGISALGASFRGATLKHSSLVGARLPNADLRGAVLQRVDLTSADLSRAHLEDVDLSTCALTGALLADAWLDRTNISPAQLVIVGEELRCDWESAARAYRSLERNFESLGESDAASRAYRRRRRAQKNASFARFRTAVGERKIRSAGRNLASWIGATTRASSLATTYWQNECESGVSRRAAQGSGSPIWLLKNCRSRSTRETRETGVPRRREASRVSRSNDSSAGVSRRCVAARDCSRSSEATPPPMYFTFRSLIRSGISSVIVHPAMQ